MNKPIGYPAKAEAAARQIRAELDARYARNPDVKRLVDALRRRMKPTKIADRPDILSWDGRKLVATK